MASISKLKPGQTLYTITRQRMGNTTLKTIAIHPVTVREVHEDYVLASWNGNPARKFNASAVSGWKVSRPLTVNTEMGGRRLATRAEIAAFKAKAG